MAWGMSTPMLSRGDRPRGRVSFNEESAKAFGVVVRGFRKQVGLSQEALAHMADIERTHFSSIEREANQPSLWLILKIARALEETASRTTLASAASASVNETSLAISSSCI